MVDSGGNKFVKMFCDEHLTLTEIAERTGVARDTVQQQLIRPLGMIKYRNQSRINGGFRASWSVKKSGSKYAEYRERISRKVRESLSVKMENADFRLNWRRKAPLGSRLGLSTIRERMTDPVFRNAWSSKCSKGGVKVCHLRLGIHSPKLRKKRLGWSLKGLKRVGKKIIGPSGEKMYNLLERKVAEQLCSRGLRYEYEKRFPASNQNGFVSVDFTLPGNVFIEATDWDNPCIKSEELTVKFKSLRARFSNANFIVVTTRKRFPAYRKFLGTDINVYCENELLGMLQSIAG